MEPDSNNKMAVQFLHEYLKELRSGTVAQRVNTIEAVNLRV